MVAENNHFPNGHEQKKDLADVLVDLEAPGHRLKEKGRRAWLCQDLMLINETSSHNKTRGSKS